MQTKNIDRAYMNRLMLMYIQLYSAADIVCIETIIINEQLMFQIYYKTLSDFRNNYGTWMTKDYQEESDWFETFETKASM